MKLGQNEINIDESVYGPKDLPFGLCQIYVCILVV